MMGQTIGYKRLAAGRFDRPTVPLLKGWPDGLGLMSHRFVIDPQKAEQSGNELSENDAVSR